MKPPPHYTAGDVHVMDVIKAKLTPEQFVGFALGNAIKYSLRMNFKDQAEKDAKKLATYAQILSEEMDEKGQNLAQEGKSPESAVWPWPEEEKPSGIKFDADKGIWSGTNIKPDDLDNVLMYHPDEGLMIGYVVDGERWYDLMTGERVYPKSWRYFPKPPDEHKLRGE